MRCTPAFTLNFAEAMMNKNGLIAVAAGILLIGAPLMVQAGPITPNPNPAGSTINIINDPSAFNNDNPFDNAGIINIDSNSTFTNAVGATLNNAGTVNNAGTLNNAAGATLDHRFQSSLNNAGTLNNFGSYSTFVSTITNSVGATLNNYGSIGLELILFLTNDGTLINQGVIGSQSNPDSFLIYIQTAGQTINNGTLTGSVDIQGGSLRGTGTINAPVTLGSGATVAPGDATTPGTLTINGDLFSSGILTFLLGGLGLGEFDILDINGDAFFSDGIFLFDFLDHDAKAGDSWKFLFADEIFGWDSLDFSFIGLESGLTYAFDFFNGAQTLRLHSVPEPGALALFVIGLLGIGLARRRKKV